MRRHTKVTGGKFTKMNWFDRLFWQQCLTCHDEFKGETGWKSGAWVHEGGGLSRDYLCDNCYKAYPGLTR
jgi:hypothetical protein